MVSVLGVPKTSLMLDDSLAVLTKLRSCCIRGMVYYSKKKKKINISKQERHMGQKPGAARHKLPGIPFQ